MDFEIDDTTKDPLEEIMKEYPSATVMSAMQPPNLAGLNTARGLQMDANALAAAGLPSLGTTNVLSTLSPSQAAKVKANQAKVRETIALQKAEEAYAEAVLDLRYHNENRKYDTADDYKDTSKVEDELFFEKQGNLQGVLVKTKAALEALGGNPYGSLIKNGIITTAQAATGIINAGINAVGGPSFSQVTYKPGGFTAQYGDAGANTPLKIGEKDGTNVAVSTGIPALDAVIGGSTTTDIDGSISGVKTPDFGNIIENVGGILGALSLSGETVDETFDPAVVADDTLVTNPGTTTGVSLKEIAYNKAMKVFDDAGGGEAGKAAVLQALEDNDLTIADLSEQTGVSLAELETFLTPAATGDLTVSGTAATGTMGPLAETPEQAAYRKTMKVFNDAGGGEAGKAAVLQALGDNNLSLQDLADQTGVALDDIQTFLYPVSDNTTKTLTTAEMLAALNNLTGTGLKKVDSTVSDLDKINTIFGTGTGLKSETDVYKIGQIQSPDSITGGITALDEEAVFKGGLAALDDEAIFKGGSAAVDDEAIFKGGSAAIDEEEIFKGGSAAIKGKVDAVGNVDALPNKISAEGNVIDDTVYTTTLKGKVGDQITSDTPAGKVDKVETDYDFTGVLKDSGVAESLYGELEKTSQVSKVPALKTSTLRGSSGGGGYDMAAPGGSGIGVGAGGPGDLVDIEYLFERFGDTIFAPRLTEEEEDDLLYTYT